MKKKLRILHCPNSTGGQAWMVSRAERELGYQSDNVIYRGNYINYPSDYNLNISFKKRPFSSVYKTLKFFLGVVRKYDVFHFYSGETIIPFYLDLPILKLFKKKIFFTFQGCDIRRSRVCLSTLKTSSCRECPGIKCKSRYSNFLKFLKLKIMLFFANKTFVLNPDLKLISPSSVMVPYASVNINKWKLSLSEEKKEIEILHAPTNRIIKGTKYLLLVISKLKEKRYPVRLKLIEKIENKKMINYCKSADIVVDQLLLGWYGGFAVEMMALGKPVICYLNKDFFDFTSFAADIPIVNANLENLEEKLKWLIENPK